MNRVSFGRLSADEQTNTLTVKYKHRQTERWTEKTGRLTDGHLEL